MKWTFLILCLACQQLAANTLFCLSPKAEVWKKRHYHDNIYQYTTVNGPYLKSFNVNQIVDGEVVPYGKLEMPNRWTRTYSYEGHDGSQALHEAYFLSWGALMDSMKVYDVTDESGAVIGQVRGQWNTDKAALFHFYDNNDVLIGTTTLDSGYDRLVIRESGGRIGYVCEKTYKQEGLDSNHPVYYWLIEKRTGTAMNERFIWPFISFIAEVWHRRD